jgi:hypothetical protein
MKSRTIQFSLLLFCIVGYLLLNSSGQPAALTIEDAVKEGFQLEAFFYHFSTGTY